MTLSPKKVFFVSDAHLGIDAMISSNKREEKLVRWLEKIEGEADEIYLMGDIFDWWFDYAEVVPKGYVLLLGQLKKMRLNSIPIYFFTGNHDMWIFDYFEKEFGIPTYRKELIKEIYGKKFFLAHGDGLGKITSGDYFMKKTFHHPVLQWIFARIHPNTGMKIMKFFSTRSRDSHSKYDEIFVPAKETLLHFAEEQISNGLSVDYFVFGHRHIPVNMTLSDNKTQFINLGDWITKFTYGVFDREKFEIKIFED